MVAWPSVVSERVGTYLLRCVIFLNASESSEKVYSTVLLGRWDNLV